MKRKVLIPAAIVLAFFAGTISSQAASLLEKISAYLNHEITFVLNGDKWHPKDASGKNLDPITYNGSTYVPLRAVGEALKVPVDYDADKKQVILGEKRDSVPLDTHSITLDTKQSYYTSSSTRNVSELKFGNRAYKSAFKTEEVNSNQKKLVIDFTKAYSKGHFVVAASFGAKHQEMKFRVLNDKGEVLYADTLTDVAPLVEFDFDIIGMSRYLTVDFVAKVDDYSTGYVLTDVSWVK